MRIPWFFPVKTNHYTGGSNPLFSCPYLFLRRLLPAAEIAECQTLVPAFQWPDDVICRQHTATVFYCQCRLVFEARVKDSDPYPTLRAGPSYDQLQPYERNIVAIYCMRRGQGMPDSPDSSSVFWNGAVACPKPVKKRAGKAGKMFIYMCSMLNFVSLATENDPQEFSKTVALYNCDAEVLVELGR